MNLETHCQHTQGTCLMTWILIALGSVAGLIALVVIVGLLLPQNHSASRTARFKQPPGAIWAVITDHANEPSWRSDISKKERVEDRQGRAAWCETSKRGERMTFESIALDPPRKMVTRIADDNLPFGGTWTWDLQPVPGDNAACTLTITEDGEIYNPVFRFVARFIIGYRGTMDAYLKALSAKCGHSPDFVE